MQWLCQYFWCRMVHIFSRERCDNYSESSWKSHEEHGKTSIYHACPEEIWAWILYWSSFTNTFEETCKYTTFQYDIWFSYPTENSVMMAAKKANSWVISQVLQLTKFDYRLSSNLDDELQKLRCRVNYHALKFTKSINELGQKLVMRMRQMTTRFVAVHLRFVSYCLLI